MSLQQLCLQAQQAFALHFPGESPRCFQAPGRVNLIGEHTDYNGGFVLPVAIDRWVAFVARARPDQRVRLWSVNFEQASEFGLDDIAKDAASPGVRRDAKGAASPGVRRDAKDAAAPWSNYVRGVLWVLRRKGFEFCGMDAAIVGDVPIGSGLSSSAAMEVATAVTLRALWQLPLPPVQLALLCQEAENEFVGMQCGIMDQFISTLGRQGHALWIDCRSLQYELAPLPAGHAIVVCDSMKRRGLVDSQYNACRQECEQGVQLLRQHLPNIRLLRDVSSADLERYGQELPPVVLKRCRHVVSEDERTLQAVAALKAGDVVEFGRLMHASHVSLRDDYEVSCTELDRMVELAQEAPGCLGARMTGAGFGGCTVNLVRSEAADGFVRQVTERYEKATGLRPDVYVCQASAGAGEVPGA